MSAGFPGAMPLAEFLAGQSAWLRRRGFDPEETLAVTATCRDEFLAPLRAEVRAHWHRAFDFSSLSGLPLAGITGAEAVLSHAPQSGERTELVCFSLPHIGMLADGTRGLTLRRGRSDPTTACGSLAAATAWAGSHGAQGTIDPRDPEQSLVRMRLLAERPDLAELDMWSVTRVVRDLMATELWDLFTELTSPDDCDIAVVSGVVIHAPDGTDHVQSHGVRLRSRGTTDRSGGAYAAS